MLDIRRKDLTRWGDEKLIHEIARLSAQVIGGGTVLIRADFLSFAELPVAFTPQHWGEIEAMALGRDIWSYGPGETLAAVEVLRDSIIPAQVVLYDNAQA